MASNDIDQKLNEGIAAARRGDKATARRLLDQVVQSDPRNELAWMWLASVSATVAERREALERVLRINPDNQRAQEALQELGGRGGRITANESNRDDGDFNPRNLVLGVLGAAVIVAGLAGISILNQQNPDPTPTRIPVTAEPTVFIPPTPRSIIVTLGDDRDLPTLPPTWTPTWTLTPTNTPFPTATPFPVDEFELYYTSLEDGASAPDLYRTIPEDGAESTLIGEDIRDVAIDPGGLRIAFVRDVTYPADEEAGTEAVTAPELFVADLDNIDNATQITEFRTSVVASPSWSPEGRELVFVSNADGDDDLYYITPDGENLRSLTDNEWSDRDPSWSPEFGSRQIIYAAEGNTILQYEIYTFDIPEPNIEPEITQLTDATNSSFTPKWSDDGTQIVFISDRRGDGDVYVMQANGQGETLLTSADGDAEDRNPVFTPDGRWVVFASNREGDNFQTYLLSIDGNVLVRLTDNSRNDVGFDFSPNRDATFGG